MVLSIVAEVRLDVDQNDEKGSRGRHTTLGGFVDEGLKEIPALLPAPDVRPEGPNGDVCEVACNGAGWIKE